MPPYDTRSLGACPDGALLRSAGSAGARIRAAGSAGSRAGAFRLVLACLALALLTLAVLPALTACASGATTTADVDKALLGIWTTEEKLGRVVLNERGEPPESVPVGQWMSFTASGRWYHVSRYITIAIGGIGVEEGTVTARQGQIKVAGRTESFFPDAGSPQHATYRTAAPDLALLYRVATEGGEKVLYVKGNTESHETRYRRIPD